MCVLYVCSSASKEQLLVSHFLFVFIKWLLLRTTYILLIIPKMVCIYYFIVPLGSIGYCAFAEATYSFGDWRVWPVNQPRPIRVSNSYLNDTYATGHKKTHTQFRNFLDKFPFSFPMVNSSLIVYGDFWHSNSLCSLIRNESILWILLLSLQSSHPFSPFRHYHFIYILLHLSCAATTRTKWLFWSVGESISVPHIEDTSR